MSDTEKVVLAITFLSVSLCLVGTSIAWTLGDISRNLENASHTFREILHHLRSRPKGN